MPYKNTVNQFTTLQAKVVNKRLSSGIAVVQTCCDSNTKIGQNFGQNASQELAICAAQNAHEVQHPTGDWHSNSITP